MKAKTAIGNIAHKVMGFASKRSQGETTDLVVHHRIVRVTPEMIDWWWDNIDSTERYRMWHPGSHLSFTWESKAGGEHIGRIHRVTEEIAGIPATLRIRWEDPEALAITRIYSHANAGAILDDNDCPISWVLHEYEAEGEGTKMRSTFRLPSKTPRWFIKGLRKHNQEEMANFSVFLPELYEKSRERGNGGAS